jgi:hypothetical protein
MARLGAPPLPRGLKMNACMHAAVIGNFIAIPDTFLGAECPIVPPPWEVHVHTSYYSLLSRNTSLRYLSCSLMRFHFAPVIVSQ